MSRRTRPTAARRTGDLSRRPPRPEDDRAADLRRVRPRPNKWFLAAALLMQLAWIGFLAAMAVWG